MCLRAFFPRVASPFFLAAVALAGCALDAGGAPTEGAQSGSSELTQAPAVTPAASAQLVVQGGGAAGPFDLGGVVVGSTVVRLLTVTNTSATTTSGALTVALSGAADFAVVAGPSPCQGAKLAPQKKCNVVVTYAPTVLGHADAATLTVGDGNARATAALSGVGIATGVDYVVNPSPGNIALGPGQSGHLTFTVMNAGTAPGPAITSIGTDGDGSYSWFHLANDGCSKNPGLGVLATCTFDVDVTVPASPAQETGTYYLSILGAGAIAPGGATAVYSKALLTLPPAVDYVLSPAPAGATFAPGASGHVTFTVTNKGWRAGPPLTSVSLDAVFWFTKKNDACTGNTGLAAGGKCTFDVDVTVPATAGAGTSDAFVLVYAGGALDPAGDVDVYTHLVLTVP